MPDMNSGCQKTNRTFPLPPGEGQGEGASIKQLAIFDPLSPTLPLRGREYVGQQWHTDALAVYMKMFIALNISK